MVQPTLNGLLPKGSSIRGQPLRGPEGGASRVRVRPRGADTWTPPPPPQAGRTPPPPHIYSGNLGGGEDTYIEEISHSCPLSPSSFLSRTWFLEKLRTWGGGLDPSQYAIVLLVLQSTSAISAGSEVQELSPNTVHARDHKGATICRACRCTRFEHDPKVNEKLRLHHPGSSGTFTSFGL
jgi:hypothetical protein